MSGAHVYCINLRQRVDRWRRFVSQPAVKDIEQHFQFERIDAVVGKEIDIQTDKRISIRTKRNILHQKRRDHEDLDSAGAIGCYLSHASLWKKFLESNDEYCIILEDDALLPDDFVARFKIAMDSLKKLPMREAVLWQLSRPHSVGLRNALEEDTLIFTDGWAYDVVCPTTGYVLFRESAKVLLENAFPIDGHVDMYMRRCTQLGILKTVHYKHLMLSQIAVKRGDTDIQLANCELCNLPTHLSESNMTVMTKKQVVSGVVVILGLTSLVALQYFRSRR
jgi:GR25 family glycosyltransferase involved in LPS biosynthesis